MTRKSRCEMRRLHSLPTSTRKSSLINCFGIALGLTLSYQLWQDGLLFT